MNVTPSVRLLDLCHPKQWKTISADQMTSSGYPVYGANGQIGFYSEYTHEHPTLMITCRGATCGTINLSVPFSYITGNAMALDQLDSKRADIRYMRHCLEYRGLDDAITGAAQPQITRQNLARVEIPLPSLDEQRRIAAILDKADALRRGRKRAVDLIDDLSQSIFSEMFGDLEINSKNWRVLKFDEVVAIDAPLVNPRLPEYVSLLHYGPDRIERNTGKLLPAQTAQQDKLISSKFLCNQTHILYSKIRPYLNKVALSESECLCSADVYPISTNAEVAERFYVWYLLRSKAFLTFADSCSNRANIPKINREQFFAYKAPVPPLPLQRAFAKRIASIQRMAQCIAASETAMNQLFASLQYRAFSGQL